MGLENTFGKAEKPAEEKQLEVITSKKAIIKDLGAYFEQNKYEGIIDWDGSEKYFSSYMDFLQNFKLRPEIISEFNKKIGIVEEKEAFGLYLSAMMQTSYNQGNNNFKFNKVNAKCFGAFLKGQPKKPIKVEVKKELKGDYTLSYAKNCSLKSKTIEGDDSLFSAKYSSLTAKIIEGDDSLSDAMNCSLKANTLKGDFSLCGTGGCLAQITNYQGMEFGNYMKDCTIKSSNLKTLEIIKEQAWEGNNKFELKK